MKPQTFEEWWSDDMPAPMSDSPLDFAKKVARIAWQAAMENAARICDEAAADWAYNLDDFGDAEYLASAIRAASSKPPANPPGDG